MARTSKRARKTSPLNLPSAFDLFTPSKEIVLKNIWIFGPLYAVPFVFWLHSWIWSPLPNQPAHWWQSGRDLSSGWTGSPLPTYGTFLVVGFSLLWFIIIAFLGTTVQIMTQEAQLRAVQGERLDFQDLWKVVKQIGWRMFGLYIVTTLLVIVSLLTFTARYFLAPYVMLEKRVGIREALDQSAELTRDHRGSVWGILGVMILIGLFNIIPILGGLVSFALGGLYSVAPALRYQQLKRLT